MPGSSSNKWVLPFASIDNEDAIARAFLLIGSVLGRFGREGADGGFFRMPFWLATRAIFGGLRSSQGGSVCVCLLGEEGGVEYRARSSADI